MESSKLFLASWLELTVQFYRAELIQTRIVTGWISLAVPATPVLNQVLLTHFSSRALSRTNSKHSQQQNLGKPCGFWLVVDYRTRSQYSSIVQRGGAGVKLLCLDHNQHQNGVGMKILQSCDLCLWWHYRTATGAANAAGSLNPAQPTSGDLIPRKFHTFGD